MQAEEALPQSAEGTPATALVPAVQIYQGAQLQGTYPLTPAGLTVGKAPGNDLVIPGAHVSRVHARITGEAGCWRVQDLGSTNGTFVYEGDRLVYSSRVQPGAWELRDQQELRLGPHPTRWRLVFSDPTTTDKSPPLAIDAQRRQVWVRGLQIRLPRDHYTVLLALYQQAPAPCSYEDLCKALDRDRRGQRRPAFTTLAASPVDALQHLIHRLRTRIEVHPRQPRIILHEPHVGYRLQNTLDSE